MAPHHTPASRAGWPARLAARAGLAGLVVLGAAVPARAGGFSVLPTLVQLGEARGVQSVLLTNTSAQTMTVESQVAVWPEAAPDQQASDVVVTPAVVTLPPGQRMRVRIGLLRPGSGQAERAYRLYFTELPAPAPLQGAGIGVRLRIGIPVFATPQQARAQPLRWQLVRLRGTEADPDADGWWLEARNPGNVHARLAAPMLVDGPHRTPMDAPSLYVLAGNTLRLKLPGGSAPATGARVQWQDGDDVRNSAVDPH